MVSFLSNQASSSLCLALKIVARFCTASSPAEFGAKVLPRGCTRTFSARPTLAPGGVTEAGSAIAARGVTARSGRTVTRETKCMIVPRRIDDPFSSHWSHSLSGPNRLQGIEFVRATCDLRVPIPRHLLHVSTMDRQAATRPHWRPRGGIAK